MYFNGSACWTGTQHRGPSIWGLRSSLVSQVPGLCDAPYEVEKKYQSYLKSKNLGQIFSSWKALKDPEPRFLKADGSKQERCFRGRAMSCLKERSLSPIRPLEVFDVSGTPAGFGWFHDPGSNFLMTSLQRSSQKMFLSHFSWSLSVLD